MKIINVFIAFIISTFTTLIYLPVKISGGFSGVSEYNGRINGIPLLLNKYNKEICWDCFNYKIRWNIAITQLIIIFIVVLFTLIIFDKRRNKK